MKIVIITMLVVLALLTACVNVQLNQPAATPATIPPASTPATQAPGNSTVTPANAVSSFNLPEVTVFSIQPFNTVANYPAVIKWEVKNATDVVIEPNIGIVQPIGQKDLMTPFGTTNYKLTATNAQGSIIATTTLTISGDLPGRDTPVIKQFTASPYVIKKGDSATLSWKTQAASAVTLDGKTVGADGSMKVTPGETSEYVLIATSSDGTQYQTITVNVK